MTVPAEYYSSTFAGVFFMAGKARGRPVGWEIVETLMPSVVPGVAAVYRDFLGRNSDKMSLPILVENSAQLADLVAVGGYPGGTLTTPEGSWIATLDSIDSRSYRENGPQVCTAEFTLSEEATVEADTPAPIAGFVTSATGLLVELDANQGGTWTSDGSLTEVDIEWGDGDTSEIGPGTFYIGGIPSAFHTYAAPDTYVVTISLVSGGVRSADESQLVTVA